LGWATVSSSRVRGSVKLMAKSRPRGQPLLSKRQMTVCQVAAAVHEDDRDRRLLG
jgi:hypothetical protein